MGMTPYVSIDLETTGLDPTFCQILEIGAVLDDWCAPVDELSVFHAYVVHPTIRGEAYALAMNTGILEIIAERLLSGLYLTPYAVGPHFRRWLEAKGIDPKSVTAAGKNFGSFDLQFLNRLDGFSDEVTFHHRSIDPAMFYWKPDLDTVVPSLQACLDRANVNHDVDHTAIEDARAVVKLIRAAFK